MPAAAWWVPRRRQAPHHVTTATPHATAVHTSAIIPDAGAPAGVDAVAMVVVGTGF